MSDFYFNGWAPEYGQPKEKFDRNAEAVKLAKALQEEGRKATADEQKILANFIGWGDSRVNRWLSTLEDVMTEDEMRTARASALNAHYTALPVVYGMWRALERLGIFGRRLRVLDPSAGPGTFKAATPEHLRDQLDWTQIELDALTFQMLNLLHPGSRNLNVGFEKAELPFGIFDLAISNIPFGDYGVHTRNEMPAIAKRAIHNFFMCNTYHYLREGGIMAYITSRYTLDAKETVVRKWLAERFTLLDAIRLPSDAFTKNAGTEVVTDVLFLQKIPLRTVEDDWDWVGTKWYVPPGENTAVTLNKHYYVNKEKMLGTPTLTGTMYARNQFNLVSRSNVDLSAEMDKALADIRLANIIENEAPIEVRTDETVIRTKEETSPLLAGMWDIYKAAKELIKAETHGFSTVNKLRKALNEKYDSFVAEYGLLTRHYQKIKGAEAYFLAALEPNGKKADIFKRSTTRKLAQLQAASASDALLLCLDSLGKVDIDWIASYKGIEKGEVIKELGDAIYLEPNTMEWQTAEQYLSGNVRKKLKDARAFAVYDEQFKRNAIALEAVVPPDVEAKNIRVPLGSGWVPADIMIEFVEHLADGGNYKMNYVEKLASWILDVKYFGNMSNVNSKWGTGRMNMYKILQHGLNSEVVKVWDQESDGTSVLNETETLVAQQKLEAIKEEFQKWIWADEERAAQLCRLYNDTYNATVPTHFNGAHLSTPGLTEIFKGKPFTLRINQKNLAWRIVQRQAVMGDHGVGAGKTAAAITGIMESIRLGLVKKAMVVVPNHTMYGEDSWASAIVQLYPGANVLIPEPKDLEAKNRSTFMSMIATNNWDIVLVPFSTFKMLPVSEELQKAYFQEQVDELKDALEEAKGSDDNRVVKAIEKAIKRFETKLEKLSDFKKDSTKAITFEELGLDMLVVDEFHGFKNLYFTTKMSRIAGLSNTESQRATDMFIKSQWFVKHGGKFVGLTGTVVTNTMAEMFTMMRYFMKAALGELGLIQFDAWARQFALDEAGLEMTPDGGGYRMVVRFRKFVNLPEMMNLWLDVADVFHIEDSDEIERPDLYKGKPIKVLSDGGEAIFNLVQELATRAERIKSGQVNPKEDNMLKITSEGRKAALDITLVVPGDLNGPMPKIDSLTENVYQIWRATKEVKGTQLIFCDLGTPKGKDDEKKKPKEEVKVEVDIAEEEAEETAERMKDTKEEAVLNNQAYEIIKKRLILRGIPEEEIAFIHSFHTPTMKGKLKNAVNNGDIRILLGSNEKMGTGLNVQKRLIAGHHVTPPWRPGDLEQQVGRYWRQGNTWPTVFQFVYVMQGSFDGYSWQTLENKAGFILQVKKGSTSLREIDDIGDGVLTYTEIKSQASGDPRVAQKYILDTELARMRSLYYGWKNSIDSLQNKIRSRELWVTDQKAAMLTLQKSLDIRNAHKTEEWQIELLPVFGAEQFEVIKDKAVAGGRILMLAEQAAKKCQQTSLHHVTIGRMMGIEINATAMEVRHMDLKSETTREYVPLVYINVDGSTTPIEARGPEGVILSLDAHMRNMDKNLQKMKDAFEQALSDIKAAEEEIAKPWEFGEKYNRLSEEVEELNKELNPQPEKKDGEDVVDGAEVVKEAIKRKSIPIDNSELDEALEAIRAMAADPKILGLFLEEVKAEETSPKPEPVAEPEPVVCKKPARKERGDDWRPAPVPGEAVQLSLFGF